MSTPEQVEKFANHLKKLCSLLTIAEINQIVDAYKKAGDMEREKMREAISVTYKPSAGQEKYILFKQGQTDKTTMLQILADDFKIPTAYVGDIDDLLRPALLELRIKSYEEVLEKMTVRRGGSLLDYEHENLWQKKVPSSEKGRS
jgi:phage gp29-like protein